MKSLAIVIGAAALVAITGATTNVAQADLINWAVSDGVFDDGGTFSGTFSIDSSTDTVTQWDLTTTTGTNFDGITYPGGIQSSATFSGTTAEFDDLVAVVPLGVIQNLVFTDLPDTGGTVADLTGFEGLIFCLPIAGGGCNVVDSRAIVSGAAASVTEPASLALFAPALLGLGFLMSRKR